MFVELLVVVGADITSRKHLLEVLEESRVDRHHVLEMAVDGTVFLHDDLPVFLSDGRLDLADLFVEKEGHVLLSVENFLPRFPNTIRTERIGLPRPAERR